MPESEIDEDARGAVILLECGRTMIFRYAPPKTGERIWCPRHMRYDVVKDGRAEFRVTCQHCRLSRPYGAAKETATRAAMKHARRYEGHVTELRQGSAVLHVFNARNEPTLDDALADAEAPPF